MTSAQVIRENQAKASLWNAEIALLKEDRPEVKLHEYGGMMPDNGANLLPEWIADNDNLIRQYEAYATIFTA
jgi:hypothetical protein